MSKEMEVIVIIHVILQIVFATHIVLKIEDIPQFKLRHITSCDWVRSIMHQWKYMMDDNYKTLYVYLPSLLSCHMKSIILYI